MRWIAGGFFLALGAPAHAQLYNPPPTSSQSVDLSQYATKAEVQSATSSVVRSVNAAAPDGTGNVVLPVPTSASIASQITTATSGLATQSALNAVSASIPSSTAITSQITTATSGLATQSALAAVSAAIPAPASTVPGMEIIGGAAGTGSTFRRGDAVQPRITRSVAFTTGSGGTVAVTWPEMTAVPLVFPIANVASGATQGSLCFPVVGTITTTGATIKCFTTQTVTVSVLGAVVAPITTAAAGVTGQVIAIPAS